MTFRVFTIVAITTFWIAIAAANDCPPRHSAFTPKIPISQNLTFDLLASVATQSGTLDRTLGVLAAKYPKYLVHHTLMHCSPSLQNATFENPRAIVFGPYAKFIFTFNGHPGQAGHHGIETGEFSSDGSGTFLLREVSYRKEGEPWSDGLRPEEIDVQRSTNLVRVSKPNPRKCMGCHALGKNLSAAVPNFPDYSMWPCAFGSNDDILYQQLFKEENGSLGRHGINFPSVESQHSLVSQGRRLQLKKGVADNEVLGFSAFLNEKQNLTSRYRHLPDRAIDTIFRKIADSGKFSVQHRSFFENEALKMGVESSDAGMLTRPNLAFQEKLNQQHLKRLSTDIKANKNIGDVAAKLLWIKTCAVFDVDTFNPQPIERSFVSTLKKVFSPMELTKLKRTVGSPESFERAFLEQHLRSQTHKLWQLEAKLGTGSVEEVPEPQSQTPYQRVNNYWRGSNVDFYSQKLGRSQFSRLELLAMNADSGPIALTMAQTYILKSVGFDLQSYSTNFLGSQRTGTFPLGATQCLEQDALKASYTGENLQKIQGLDCDTLLKIATGLVPISKIGDQTYPKSPSLNTGYEYETNK